MSGAVQVTKQNHSYKPEAAVLGGRLLEATTNGTVQHAAAGSVKVMGVGLTDAINTAAQTGQPTVVNGVPVLNTALMPTVVAVANDVETVVEYVADCAFGVKLVAAADGKVTPAGATPDARTIVGRCTQPGGVVVATKTSGLARIF